MKKVFILFLLISPYLNAQYGEWTWMRGDSTALPPGSYGTLGVTDSTNDPSGTFEPVCWTDSAGYFYMFGGMVLSPAFGLLADIWKYDPLINQWTWINGTGIIDEAGNYGTMGVATPTNLPPARCYGASSWTDLNGNFWLYGGHGTQGPGDKADLWKYDPSTNQWTWMNGSSGIADTAVYGTRGVPDPSNTPGSRSECSATWTDSNGDLFLFGGNKSGYGGQSDLWKYNIATNMWTWMKGPKGPTNYSHYGIKMVEDSANNPSGRFVYSRWKDNNGNFWMFGGKHGVDYLNDLWKYNPQTNNWTWMSGDSTGTPTGNYISQCVGSTDRNPSGRLLTTTTWIDKRGNLWLYSGGIGASSITAANDLWMYCISNNQRTWVKGDSVSNTAGSYGTKGISSPTNNPSGRMGAGSWMDVNGNLYVFGGDDPGPITPYNDMWRFVIDTNCAGCNLPTTVSDFSEPEINVYPNPAQNVIHISGLENKSTLILYDICGRKVFEKISDQIKEQIDVSKLSNGMYILSIIKNSNSLIKRILIE